MGIWVKRTFDDQCPSTGWSIMLGWVITSLLWILTFTELDDPEKKIKNCTEMSEWIDFVFEENYSKLFFELIFFFLWLEFFFNLLCKIGSFFISERFMDGCLENVSRLKKDIFHCFVRKGLTSIKQLHIDLLVLGVTRYQSNSTNIGIKVLIWRSLRWSWSKCPQERRQ